MESLEKELLKLAYDAFERATTMQPQMRLEVYLENQTPKMTSRLSEEEEIVYGPTKIRCYQISGHNHLEEEIVSWIDMARIIPQPTDDTPLPEPTAIESAIREMVLELAKNKSVSPDTISSYEVFANMPMTLLGEIEQKIIEFWWDGAEEENAKLLAKAQIQEALHEAGVL
ncbi:MAG: hypothetical protein K0U47_03060 [Epsilonproteobacteria bacterium]|nr:hypothetical protein [Campylobacterota bacterium]